MNTSLLLKSLIAMVSLVASGQAISSGYKFTDLTPTSGNGKASAINNAGQIVGALNGSAVIWNAGSATSLQTDAVGSSYAFAVNNSGVAVGAQFSGSGLGWANQWDKTGAATQLQSGVFAYAINDKNEIVGSTKNELFGPSHAALWRNGSLTALASPYGDSNNSVAAAINNYGVIVGSAVDNNNVAYQAVEWRDGNAKLLSNLGGSYTYANAVNDAGIIVGSSETADGQNRAVMWRDGNLAVLDSSGDYAQASSINAQGQIVGLANTSAGGVVRATLWDKGQMVDLSSYLDPTLASQGWLMYAATGINDHGVIVGYLQHESEYKAFMLTPEVPEPQGYAMLATGLVTLGLMLRRNAAVNVP